MAGPPGLLPPDASSVEERRDRESAPAKINLALHVRGRRDDGYHALESLFVFAEHGDELTAHVTGQGELELVVDGPFAAGLVGESDNLVLRAARLLRDRSGFRGGAGIRLTKRLPVASGIGGGSADAAATLRLLNRVWALNLPLPDLLQLAEALGSDVPACVAGGALRVTGRGEKLEAVSTREWHGAPLLLVNPGVALSTADVFAAWDGVDRGPLDGLDMNGLEMARNDLEGPACALAPRIREVLDRLGGATGATLTRMSGSGATCFALFDSESSRDRAGDELASARPEWWQMRTRIA